MHLMVFFDSSVIISSDKTGGLYSSVQVFVRNDPVSSLKSVSQNLNNRKG